MIFSPLNWELFTIVSYHTHDPGVNSSNFIDCTVLHMILLYSIALVLLQKSETVTLKTIPWIFNGYFNFYMQLIQ